MTNANTPQAANGRPPLGDNALSVTEQAKGFARDLQDKAADLTDNVTRAAKDTAADLGAAAASMASDAKGKATTAINDQVSQKKSLGADYIGNLAQAVNRAAGEFEADVPQAAHFIRQASDQMQEFADAVRERDVRELVGEVQDFARRQPTLFFGGAVLLGFAALRFLKSSPPTATQEFSNHRPDDNRGYASREQGLTPGGRGAQNVAFRRP
ncbi:MAG: hypothetical protein ACR2K5_16225 [Pseudolabrys sp.]